MAFKPRRKGETLDIRLKIGQSAIDRAKETVFRCNSGFYLETTPC